MGSSFIILKSARPLIAAQIIYKISGIIVNNVMARNASFSSCGVILMKYEFFFNSMLYFARDSIRLYGNSVNDSGNSKKPSITVWSPLFFGILVGFPCFLIQLYRPPDQLSVLKYRFNFLLYYLGFLTDCMCVPLAHQCAGRNVARMQLIFDVVSFLFKTLLLAVLSVCKLELISANGLAQFFSCIFKLSCYLLYYFTDRNILFTENLPHPKLGSEIIHYHVLCIKASISNFLLHFGDSFLCSVYLNSEDQGIYGIVSGYGTILYKLLFAPSHDALSIDISNRISFSAEESLISSEFFAFKTTALAESFHIFYRCVLLNGILASILFSVGFWNTKSILYFAYGADWALRGHFLLSEFILLTLLSSFAGNFEVFALKLMRSRQKSNYLTLHEILGYFYFLLVHNLTSLLGIHALIIPKIVCISVRLGFSAYIIWKAKDEFFIQHKWSATEKQFLFFFILSCTTSFVILGHSFRSQISFSKFWSTSHSVVSVISLFTCVCAG